MLAKFLQIYSLQERNLTFSSPEDLLLEVDLYSLTQKTMREEIHVSIHRRGHL